MDVVTRQKLVLKVSVVRLDWALTERRVGMGVMCFVKISMRLFSTSLLERNSTYAIMSRVQSSFYFVITNFQLRLET